MSITQTYYLAHKARAKLAKEASRSDHNLRYLVGHANLLDCLMLELADAEREQESWFNQSVRGAAKHEQEDIDYEDTIIEVPDEDWDSDSDSCSDSDCDSHEEDEDDVEMADIVSYRRVPVPDAPITRITSYDEDDDMDEDDENLADLELVRTPSHTTPPELDDDSDASEEETMPPSPPTAMLTFSEKETQEELQRQESSFYSHHFYVPERNPARIVSSIPIC